jgi:hypothetical protein
MVVNLDGFHFVSSKLLFFVVIVLFCRPLLNFFPQVIKSKNVVYYYVKIKDIKTKFLACRKCYIIISK